MADPRPQHITHRGPSLLKIPTPPYPGPGAALYGDRGPQRASAPFVGGLTCFFFAGRLDSDAVWCFSPDRD